jgi:porin
MKMHGPQIQGALIVYDSNNIPTTTGFDVLFDNGANVLGLWRFFTEHNGLPGSHLFLGSFATGEFTSLDATGWTFFPPVGIVPGEQTGSWHFTYILEQKLWVDCCKKNRNIGFLGQLGFADRKTSPFQWVMNASLQAQGLLFGRDQDTMGMGYFYSGLSDEFKGLLGGIGVGMDDLQGGEIYYNAAVTPWLHLTGDLQVIQPGFTSNDTAVVAGLRANVKF